MRKTARGSLLALSAVVFLLALLLLLGLLQYRWAGELSLAERERLGRRLNQAVEGFAADFDREIGRAFLHFITAPGDEIETTLLRLLEGWEETAPYPEMIRDLVVWSPNASSDLGVRVADRGAAEFVDGELDDRLKVLLNRRRRPFEADSREPGWRRPPVVAPAVPALLPPILRPGGPGVRRPPMRGRHGGPMARIEPGRVAVRLDLDYLRSELFPLLAERHLGVGGDEAAYRYVIVADGDEETIVFRSDPELAVADLERADAESRLFRVLPPERLGSLPREVFLSRFAGSRGFSPESRGELDRGRAWRSGVPGLAGSRMLDAAGAWRLVVQHRSGSLAAAVTLNRRRNLGVSAAVLLLLGAVVAMLVVSSRRAQELATRRVEFVAGVSHELRTPLASIRSLGQNLADGIVDSGEQVRRYGGLIEAEGSRLSRMIEQVLDYSRGLSGERRLEVAPVSVAEVLDSAAGRCASQVEEAGVDLEISIADELPRIEGDATALGGAVENLIVNALKFGAEGGWVGLSADSPDGSSIRVRVSDRGPGLEPDDRSRLFEPFYRGRRARESQAEGSGLGLSLVREVVEAHGGTVEASTVEGGGARFTIALPGARDAG